MVSRVLEEALLTGYLLPPPGKKEGPPTHLQSCPAHPEHTSFGLFFLASSVESHGTKHGGPCTGKPSLCFALSPQAPWPRPRAGDLSERISMVVSVASL